MHVERARADDEFYGERSLQYVVSEARALAACLGGQQLSSSISQMHSRGFGLGRLLYEHA
jgi:hypothetical protein